MRADAPSTTPKPLVRLLGLSLLERAIRTVQQAAGSSEIVIAVGCDGERIREELGDGRRLGVRLLYAPNPDWERGNGTSALAARPYLHDAPRFLLLMSDHVLDPGVLRALLQRASELQDADVLLAVDRAPGPHVDLDDATKVKLDEDGERLVAIGKALQEYDAIDVGAFLCTPALFEALDEALRRGDGSLSGGVQLLAQRGRVKAVDVTGHFWIDVDTPEALRQAERLLLLQLRKPTDGPVSRYLNRPLSIRLSRWLARTPLTPNQLSVLSFLLAAVGASVMALPGYPALALGGLFAQLSSVLDGCDGEVARLKLQTSERGGWFDAVLDRYADALLVSGLAYHAWLAWAAAPAGAITPWLWGLAALSGALLNSYTADKYDAFLKEQLERGKRPLRLGRDVRLLLISVGALLNLPLETLIALALVNHGEVFRRIWLLLRS